MAIGLAALGLLVVAAWSAVAQAVRSVRGIGGPTAVGADHADRFAAVLPKLPASGPEVEVYGHGIPLVGYLTAAESLTATYSQGMADPKLRQQAHHAFVGYVLAQQLLAPRILVLPISPLYAKVRLVLGDYRAGDPIPELPPEHFEKVVDTGSEVVLWQRR